MLALVAQGLGNQEIAELLCIAVSTVKSGLHRICVKLKDPQGSGGTHSPKKKHLPADYIYALEELADSIEHRGPKAMEEGDPTHTGYKKPH